MLLIKYINKLLYVFSYSVFQSCCLLYTQGTSQLWLVHFKCSVSHSTSGYCTERHSYCTGRYSSLFLKLWSTTGMILIKTLSKSGIEGSYLTIIKALFENHCKVQVSPIGRWGSDKAGKKANKQCAKWSRSLHLWGSPRKHTSELFPSQTPDHHLIGSQGAVL